MMSKNFAGIDLSMTTPSVTIGQSKDFSKTKTFFYTNNKKFVGKFDHSIYGIQQLPYACAEERYDNISDWVMSILNYHNVNFVCLEGYSMGSSNGLLFNIAENGGLLKHKLWKNKIEFIIPAPTQVKKYFTGKGNANKSAMYDAFIEKTGAKIAEALNTNPDKSPISDIVDSYAMLCYGIDNR